MAQCLGRLQELVVIAANSKEMSCQALTWLQVVAMQLPLREPVSVSGLEHE